eukprot:414791-Pyramimonas_sp.AAC.1
MAALVCGEANRRSCTTERRRALCARPDRLRGDWGSHTRSLRPPAPERGHHENAHQRPEAEEHGVAAPARQDLQRGGPVEARAGDAVRLGAPARTGGARRRRSGRGRPHQQGLRGAAREIRKETRGGG